MTYACNDQDLKIIFKNLNLPLLKGVTFGINGSLFTIQTKISMFNATIGIKPTVTSSGGLELDIQHISIGALGGLFGIARSQANNTILNYCKGWVKLFTCKRNSRGNLELDFVNFTFTEVTLKDQDLFINFLQNF